MIDVNKIVEVSCYGNGKRDYGNTNRVDVGNLAIWFSYETIVAFQDDGELVVCKNNWQQTTGKHLNLIDSDKSKRLDRKEFEEKLKEAFIKNKLIDAREEIAKNL